MNHANRHVGALAADVRIVWFTHGAFDDYWACRNYNTSTKAYAYIESLMRRDRIDPSAVAIYELPRDCVEMCEVEELGETRRACEQMQADEECPF